MSDTRNVRAMGVGWYSPEAWKQLAAIPEAHIQKSYADFVTAFDQAVRGYAAQGIAIEKIHIDIDHMLAWCHRHGYAIDDRGRAVYGVVMSMARDDPGALQAPVIDNTRVAG